MQNECNRSKVIDNRPLAAARKHCDTWQTADSTDENDQGHRNFRDINNNAIRNSSTNDPYSHSRENVLDSANSDMIAERDQSSNPAEPVCKTDRQPQPTHHPNPSTDKSTNINDNDADTFRNPPTAFCESNFTERTRGGCGKDSCCEANPCRCDKNDPVDDHGCSPRPGILKSHARETSESRRADPPCKTCATQRRCCPPAGFRPVCQKVPRCRPPCTGDSRTCGGGGCCGSGCRGGCGKPGQICMPSRPCTTPPCKPCPPPCFGGCLAQGPGQPPSCPRLSRAAMIGGGGSSCCRPRSPRCRTPVGRRCCTADERAGCDGGGCCRQKLPPGCECLGGGLDCRRCGRKVYQAEMQIASGVPYHNICFSCYCCRKPLEPLNYQENCGEIYCKQCYVRNFGPQGYGYGVGAGVLQTPL